MFKTRWRVVTDAYAGYEVQFRYWWMPFYIQKDITTFSSIERAKAAIQRYKKKVVYQE